MVSEIFRIGLQRHVLFDKGTPRASGGLVSGGEIMRVPSP